jgi:hypothetical protein
VDPDSEKRAEYRVPLFTYVPEREGAFPRVPPGNFPTLARRRIYEAAMGGADRREGHTP